MTMEIRRQGQPNVLAPIDHPSVQMSVAGLNSPGLQRYWLRGTVVERRSFAGKLSLSCARPAADG